MPSSRSLAIVELADGVVAGGETAGIPYAAFIAERLGLPMLYVRKKPKGFGRDARIEGDLKDGQRVLLVEDLTTDGGSKVNFVEAIREAGAECAHTIVVFYYDIFKRLKDFLAKTGFSWVLVCKYCVFRCCVPFFICCVHKGLFA